MKPQKPVSSLANLSATFSCAVLGSAFGSFIYRFLNEGDESQIVPFLLSGWLAYGAHRLEKIWWKRSYGNESGLAWLWKDTLAMLIWPVLHSRIQAHKKKDSP